MLKTSELVHNTIRGYDLLTTESWREVIIIMVIFSVDTGPWKYDQVKPLRQYIV